MKEADTIIVVDVSEVREGKLDEVKLAFKELSKFVEVKEDRPFLYNVYVDKDGGRVTVLQVHPDSPSMELHMEVAGPEFSKFSELLKLKVIDVYGEPTDKLLRQLQRKAEKLGGARLNVHKLHAGFARIGTL